jgi:signal peptidase I
VVATNLGVRVRFQAFLPVEANDQTIKRVMVTPSSHGPQEHIVGFSRHQGSIFLGEMYLDPFLLGRSTREWIQQNVSIQVGEFPLRVACTGSMRPYIDCGDRVLYEPVLAETPLVVGDVVTFRLSDDDVDIQRDCPWLANIPGLSSVSALYGTQRVYIIHRIVDTVRGSHPPAYITRGDNNALDDGCVVRKPSIVFKVVDVVKDHYVIDQGRYNQHVSLYQQLLEEYWQGIAQFQEMRDRYDASVREYQRMAATGASQATLDDYYRGLERLRREINELVERLNQLPGQMESAQRGIEAAVAPFFVQ